MSAARSTATSEVLPVARPLASESRTCTARPEPDELERYEVLCSLGGGELSSVHLAVDWVLGRRVVLKRPRPGAPRDEVRERFQREARAAARVDHPSIVKVHDFGDDPLFIAMEHVPGPTLSDWLSGERTRSEVLAVFRQIGDALTTMHGHGVVHGDIEAHNIVVAADGPARLIGFGLAHSRTEHAAADQVALCALLLQALAPPPGAAGQDLEAARASGLAEVGRQR